MHDRGSKEVCVEVKRSKPEKNINKIKPRRYNGTGTGKKVNVLVD